jgi:tetratricopeptide (TPR) repeat protein
MKYLTKTLVVLLGVLAIIVLSLVAVLVYRTYKVPSVAESVTAINSDFNNNKVDLAISQAQVLAAQYPDNINAKLVLAMSYAQKGSLAFQETEYANMAIVEANQVLVLDPNNSEAYRIIGYADEIEQKYPAAITNYNKAISLNPKSADAYANRGHAYELQGNYKNAMADYATALSINSVLDQANLKAGELYAKEGSTTEAMPFLTKVLSLDTNVRFKAEAENDLGVIALNAGDYKTAVTDFTGALSYDQTLAIAYVNRATAKLDLNTQVGKAEYTDLMSSVFQDLQTALVKNPNLSAAYMLLAKASFIAGDNKAANTFLLQGQGVVNTDITLDASQKTIVKDQITRLLALVK